ncbi:unnamed protein product, partial [Prorocentrum cordatum]
MSPYSLGPPAALTRARCRACGDFVIGYVLNCTICDSEVHAHCMTPYQGHPVCHACHAERDYMMAQRQAAWSGHIAQQVARTAASGAQLVGHTLGATLSTAATGAARLAIGAAAGVRQSWSAGAMMPHPVSPIPEPTTTPAEQSAQSSQHSQPGGHADQNDVMSIMVAELRELRLEVQRLSRRNEQLEAERLADRAAAAVHQQGYQTPLAAEDSAAHDTPSPQHEAPMATAQQGESSGGGGMPHNGGGGEATVENSELITAVADALAETALSAPPQQQPPAGLRETFFGEVAAAASDGDGAAAASASAGAAAAQQSLQQHPPQQPGGGPPGLPSPWPPPGWPAGDGLDTVLAKLRESDLMKLEFVKGQPKASALEDWLQRAGLKVGGWHRRIDAFWKDAVAVAQEGYAEYLKLTPMQRPLVRPRLDWLAGDAKLQDIELKLRPILLEAVPDSVRQEALATRATSTVEILFATMVAAGPGTLKDKTEVLASVERRGLPAVELKSVHDQLQKWHFNLVRLQRLSMQPPDPTVQIGVLRNMVGRMIEHDASFQHRIFAWEMQHGISGASQCTQGQVDEYWRYLSAESREISDSPAPGKGAAVKAQIARLEALLAKGGAKGDQGKAKTKDDKGKSKGALGKAKGDKDKDKSKVGKVDLAGGGAPQVKKPCRDFESDRGCKNGAGCQWHHRALQPWEHKCFNCGSKSHSKAECPHPRAAGAQQQHPRQQPQPLAAAAAAGAAGAASTSSTEPPLTAAGVQEAVARAMQSLAVQGDSCHVGWADPFGAPPLRQQQQPEQPQPQFRMLQVLGPRTATAAAAGSGRIRKDRLLCDTGASHELQHLWPHEAPPARSVQTSLGLAVGDRRGVHVSEDDVVYVHSPTPVEPLFPIGVYMHELGLDLLWGSQRAAVVMPRGGTMELELENGMAYISEQDAEVLRQMRRRLRLQRGAARFRAGALAAVIQLSLAEHKAGGHRNFRPDCAECRLAAGRLRHHWRLEADTRPGGQLSADISGPHPPARWPSALQEDRPRQPRFFLLCAYCVFTVAEQEQAAENERFARDGPKVEVKGEPAQVKAEAADGPGADDQAAVAKLIAVFEATAKAASPGGFEDQGDEILVDLPGDMEAGRRTWYFTWPLVSKSAAEVMKALELIIAQIGLEFQCKAVFRMHADGARELSGPQVRAGLAGQGIVVTSTPGYEPDNNPRAERGIGVVKQRARAMLMALPPADREQLWPAAVQHSSALQRREAQGRPTSCPPFGAPVTCKIKQKPSFAFAPRAADRVFLGIADFVSSAALVGYRVTKHGVTKWEFETSSSFVPHPPPPRLRGTPAPGGPACSAELPSPAAAQPCKGQEEHGAGAAPAADEDNGLGQSDVGRRLRGKQPARAQQQHRLQEEPAGGAGAPGAPGGPPAAARVEKRAPLERKLRGWEPAELNEDDFDDELPEFHEVLKDSGMQPVSGQELRRATGAERDEWFTALANELASFNEKAVFETLPPQERGTVKMSEILPMKIVAGIKPPKPEVFTQNVEISSVRMALAIAAECRWKLLALDVSTAFLNAPLPKESGRVVVRPPALMVHYGLVAADELWVAKKGIYGLRVAPRAWGLQRDSDMRGMRVQVGGRECKLAQSHCDASVWMATPALEPKLEADRELLGLVVVYVDDFLVIGPDGVIDVVEAKLNTFWACSSQVRIGFDAPGKLTYLSLEVEARSDHFAVHQGQYIDDMLAKWGLQGGNACSTIAFEPVPDRSDHDDEPDLAEVKLAQKMGGGLLWLSTRSRPDIAFAVSRLSSHACRAPTWALKLGKRILRYVLGTRRFGLVVRPFSGSPGAHRAGRPLELKLDVYADASFETDTSQSGVAVFVGDVLVDWRSQRQPQVARSTAEAEVTALNVGLLMLEGAEATLCSMGVRLSVPTLWGDNAASLFLARGQGSWRTRALANRAAALRSRLEMGTLDLVKVASEDQRADGLTKVFAAPAMARIRAHFNLQQ